MKHRLPKNDTLVTIIQNVYSIFQWRFVVCSTNNVTYDEKYFSLAKLTLSLFSLLRFLCDSPIQLMCMYAFSLKKNQQKQLITCTQNNRQMCIYFDETHTKWHLRVQMHFSLFSSVYLFVNLFAVGSLIRSKCWLLCV